MATKTGTWLIGIGVCFAFLGFCAFPAAFGPNPDKTLLSGGLTVLSTGMTLVAGGLYIKARTLRGAAVSGSASQTNRGRKASCEKCGKNEPVIQCRVHQVHLCGGCLGDHYDFRTCAYVPSTRRSTAKGAAYTHAGRSLTLS
ncbi:MAG: hypothetical protein LAO56_08810 [Acidobacteriia bacterium]|nr:hypothetical protein [Terriglobia bacterium]